MSESIRWSHHHWRWLFHNFPHSKLPTKEHKCLFQQFNGKLCTDSGIQFQREGISGHRIHRSELPGLHPGKYLQLVWHFRVCSRVSSDGIVDQCGETQEQPIICGLPQPNSVRLRVWRIVLRELFQLLRGEVSLQRHHVRSQQLHGDHRLRYCV